MKFEGIYTAIVTPFDKDLNICFDSLERLIKHQIDGGVKGFVVNGTTGESPTLTASEVRNVYKFIKEKTPKDFPLILGVGTNSTKKTMDNILFFEDLEPTAYLVVTPYYNKPPQRGLVNHFTKVSKATTRPVILYDVPGRTITKIDTVTTKKLSEVENIVAIKDATGDMDVIKEHQSFGLENFSYLSGDDGTTCEYVNLGGNGVISVLSHIIPKEFDLCIKGEEDFSKWSKLCDLLFVEANPIPVKWALYKMGIINTPHLRAPLCDMDQTKAQDLETEMKNLGLLK